MKLIFTLCIYFFAVTELHAGAVAQWAYSPAYINGDGSLNGYPTSVAAPATRSLSLVASNSPGGTYSASGWSVSAQIDLSKYFQFSVSPPPNIEYDWSLFVANLYSQAQGPTQWELRTSIDGFSGSYFSQKQPSSNAIQFDISGLSNSSSEVVFRLYGIGTTSSSAGGGFNSIEIDAGQYAVPEANSVMLFVIGTIFVISTGLTRRCS